MFKPRAHRSMLFVISGHAAEEVATTALNYHRVIRTTERMTGIDTEPALASMRTAKYHALLAHDAIVAWHQTIAENHPNQ